MATTGSVAAAVAVSACGTDAQSETNARALSSASADPATEDHPDAAQLDAGDVGSLNHLLEVEYVEAAFYATALRSGHLSGQAVQLATEFGREESAHVAVLTATIKRLKGKPAAEPKTHFSLHSSGQTLKVGTQIENLGAAAYLGQLGTLKSPKLLSLLLAMHSVEGRHSSALGVLTGTSISPDGAFARPATAAVVHMGLQQFIV
jgi:hypothetical protein